MNNTTSAFTRPISKPFYSGTSIRPLTNPNQIYAMSDPIYSWEPKVLARLQELIRLDFGWDGYSGEPVSLENAYFALNMLTKISSQDTPAPQIVPGAGGDLQLEWHTLEADIELHILAPYNVHAWISNPENPDEDIELELKADFTEVAKQIRKLKERSSDRTAAA